MKQLIGSDIGKYTFIPSSKSIVLTDMPSVSLFNLLLITNVSTGDIIYNFADPLIGADIDDNIITLEFDTTAMTSNDSLQIWLDIPVIDECAGLLRRVIEAAYSPAGFDQSLNRLRQTAIIESGTITTVTTVSTCSTVSNLSNIDGRNGSMAIQALDDVAWDHIVRSRIS